LRLEEEHRNALIENQEELLEGALNGCESIAEQVQIVHRRIEVYNWYLK